MKLFRKIYIKMGFSKCDKCGTTLGAIHPIERIDGKEIKICYRCSELPSLKAINKRLEDELKQKEILLEEARTLLEEINAGKD